MANERASELLYDTAATLRLLDAELGELAPRATTTTATGSHQIVPDSERVLPLLPALFVRAMGEVQSMLASIRTGRERLRATSAERLAHTSEKLDEVTNATAHAALDIMDALDRAIAKVDELEADDVLADPARGAAIRGEIRDELFAVMNHMQFQDITSQQIMHVQSLLSDTEHRLSEIATMFDHQTGEATPEDAPEEAPAVHAVDPKAFDPNATLSDADARQALADSLVGRSAPAA
jgi:chemotaxis regulatin CheY-phosphate phosphatase CheZ